MITATSEECSTGGPQVLQRIALAMASERSVEAVLQKIVGGLAEQPRLDLARIYLVQPGGPNDSPSLQLSASAGKPLEMRRQSGAPIDDKDLSRLIP